MKKKILLTLFAISITISGCENSSPATVETIETTEVFETAESVSEPTSETEPEEITPEDITDAVESLQETIQNEVDSIVDNYSPQETTKSLNSLCQYLEDSNLVSGERIEMAGEMIGAISGVKYKDCNVEIYEYDTSSEKYKELVSNGKILMEGFNVEVVPSIIHNQFVLICDDAPNKDELIAAFDSLN